MCSYIYSFLCSATQTFHVESSFFSWVISCSISSSENPLVMTVSPLFLLYKSSWFYFFIIIILNIYLFIWLCQLLVAALGFFDFWCSLHDLSCTMQTLSWGMWDLVPSPGIKPGLPALGARSLSHWTTVGVPVLFESLWKYDVVFLLPLLWMRCQLQNKSCSFEGIFFFQIGFEIFSLFLVSDISLWHIEVCGFKKNIYIYMYIYILGFVGLLRFVVCYFFSDWQISSLLSFKILLLLYFLFSLLMVL